LKQKGLETCEVCGKESSKLFKRIIDSAEMMVCFECKDYGEEPPEVRRRKIEAVQANAQQKKFQGLFTNDHPTTPRINSGYLKKGGEKKTDKFDNFKIVDDAPKRLIELRTKLGYTADLFAESVSIKRTYYTRLERGETAISLDLARRIEQKYKIKLVEEDVAEESKELDAYMKKSKASPEGMVYFRKRGQAPEYDQDLTKKH